MAGSPISASAIKRLAEGVLLVALAALFLGARPFHLESRAHALAVARMLVERLDPGDLGEIGLTVRLLEGGGVGEARCRRLQADGAHRLAEQLAVLRLVDGVGVGADHLDAEFVEDAHLLQRQGGVEGRLPAHGRQQGVGTLLLDDLGDDLGRDRLHIGGVGEIGIGHDRRRVRIDQDDPVALFAQRLAGLGAGIIELGGLADDDRPRPDDEDRGDIVPFGHSRDPSVLDLRPARRSLGPDDCRDGS